VGKIIPCGASVDLISKPLGINKDQERKKREREREEEEERKKESVI